MKASLGQSNFWKINLAVIVLLAGLNWFLRLKIDFLKKESGKNLALLNEALPGFNEEKQRKFRQEMRESKERIAGYLALLHPSQRWLRKDYDRSILFVEDLNNISQALKNKAGGKQVVFADLEFPEKLPAEPEAANLLSQLHSLKEVLSLGIDLGINFKAIKPQAIEKVAGLTDVWLAKNSLELSSPKEALMEFIVQLNDIIPRPCLDSLLIKSESDSFTLTLNFSNVLFNVDWIKDIKNITAAKPDTLPKAKVEDYAAILRNKNPFFMPVPKESVAATEVNPAPTKEEPAAPRFLYRGKAVLKKKEVVVIEDTLNKETVFLRPQELIGKLRLRDFSDAEAVLENVDDGTTITIKREE